MYEIKIKLIVLKKTSFLKLRQTFLLSIGIVYEYHTFNLFTFHLKDYSYDD